MSCYWVYSQLVSSQVNSAQRHNPDFTCNITLALILAITLTLTSSSELTWGLVDLGRVGYHHVTVLSSPCNSGLQPACRSQGCPMFPLSLVWLVTIWTSASQSMRSCLAKPEMKYRPRILCILLQTPKFLNISINALATLWLSQNLKLTASQTHVFIVEQKQLLSKLISFICTGIVWTTSHSNTIL